MLVSKQHSNLWPWLITVTLALAMVISIIDRFALSLVLEPIKQAFSINDTEIGMLQGLAFGLFYAVLGVPCGWLADRWSRAGTIILGLFIWSVATAACGLAGGFAGLLIARICVGAGEAALAPAAYAIIHQRFAKNLIYRALSVFQVGAVIGAGTAFYLVGGIYDYLKSVGTITWPLLGELAPWQGTFIIVAIPGFILLPFLWFVLHRDARLGSGTADRGKVSASDHALMGATQYLIADKGFIFALFVGMSGLITMNYALLSWVPSIFNREFGWTPGQIGKPYGLIVLCASSAGMFIAAWIADRLQKSSDGLIGMRVPFVAAILAIPLSLSLLIIETPTLLLVCVAALHALGSCSIGIGPALVQQRTPDHIRSRISAVYVMTINICGLAIGPLVVGRVATAIGAKPDALRISVAIIGTIVLVISVISFWKFIFSKNGAKPVVTHASTI